MTDRCVFSTAGRTPSAQMFPLIGAAAAGSRSRAFAALRALPTGVTLSVKSGGKDRADGHAGR
jgi:hypothetical protein